MADLDLIVDAVVRAASKAGLVCEPGRAQILFVVEKEIENPGLMGNPQASLQASLQSIADIAAGGEDDYAAALVASVMPHFPK